LESGIKIREEGQIRMNPPYYSSRRYYLNQLRKQIEFTIRHYIKDKGVKTLLDYGSGNSPYKPLFLPYITDYRSADLAENPAATFHLNQKGGIEGHDKEFDVVLSTQVLEHVHDPSYYLSECFRLLQKDGLLILSTHGYWMYHPDPTDYWRWTSSGLKKIIDEAGFEIIYFRGIIGRNAMGLQLFQDGFLFKMPRLFRPVWSIVMQFFISFTNLLNSKNAIDQDACTYVVVAKPIYQ
jgi:SAM-dependent methyltransferase